MDEQWMTLHYDTMTLRYAGFQDSSTTGLNSNPPDIAVPPTTKWHNLLATKTGLNAGEMGAYIVVNTEESSKDKREYWRENVQTEREKERECVCLCVSVLVCGGVIVSWVN